MSAQYKVIAQALDCEEYL